VCDPDGPAPLACWPGGWRPCREASSSPAATALWYVALASATDAAFAGGGLRAPMWCIGRGTPMVMVLQSIAASLYGSNSYTGGSSSSSSQSNRHWSAARLPSGRHGRLAMSRLSIHMRPPLPMRRRYRGVLPGEHPPAENRYMGARELACAWSSSSSSTSIMSDTEVGGVIRYSDDIAALNLHSEACSRNGESGVSDRST
jgi:hypothetical protein